MNVRQMLEEIPKRHPNYRLQISDDRTVDSDWFRLYIPNGWLISVGYGRTKYCDNRMGILDNSKDAMMVEIAIFDNNNNWYIPEGAENVVEHADGTRSGVLGWQTSDQLFRVIDYISEMKMKPP